MSVYGSSPWSRSMREAVRQAVQQINEQTLGLKRGYADPSIIDLVEVNGVWMTPEDARRMAA